MRSGNPHPDEFATGCVYLVGAGPGDPELLTVKAARLLNAADVVVYDRLVSAAVLDLVPAGTPRIYAGKAAANHHMPQSEINRLLAALAGAGRRVVRLKGGDPFVFGRGSEEAEYLARAGIAFAVVPGITAASGCAAAIGVPLTHRGLATGVRYVTGHCRAEADLDLNWASLADPDTTLVFYMSLANLPQISTRLMAAGLPGTTPAVAIASGTTRRQRVHVDTLEGLPQAVHEAALTAPVLVVIGRVVALAALTGVPALPETEDHVATGAAEARERSLGG